MVAKTLKIRNGNVLICKEAPDRDLACAIMSATRVRESAKIFEREHPGAAATFRNKLMDIEFQVSDESFKKNWGEDTRGIMRGEAVEEYATAMLDSYFGKKGKHVFPAKVSDDTITKGKTLNGKFAKYVMIPAPSGGSCDGDKMLTCSID